MSEPITPPIYGPSLPSDLVLFQLNQALNDALLVYLTPGIQILFDVPEDPDTGLSEPTVSVFLYAIQEDLELRNGMPRQTTELGTGQVKLEPGVAHIKCDYLITFWEAPSDEPGTTSQAMQVMNQVLNALLNFRSFPGLPQSYTRVMTSQELNSLGNFWQALGKKPRLCLNYSATVPLRLTDKQELYAAVQDPPSLVMNQLPIYAVPLPLASDDE